MEIKRQRLREQGNMSIWFFKRERERKEATGRERAHERALAAEQKAAECEAVVEWSHLQ